MIISFFDVIGHHIFKWQHAGDIQITCARDKVFLVRVLTGQLPTDKVAAVIISKDLYMFKQRDELLIIILSPILCIKILFIERFNDNHPQYIF